MNLATFTKALHNIDEATWQAIATGQALAMLDDKALVLVAADAERVIVEAHSEAQASNAQAEALWARYYRRNPISKASFQHQLAALVHMHGPAAFYSIGRDAAAYSLIVEQEQLLAIDASNARHRYGLCLELEKPIDDEQKLHAMLDEWLKGKAYDQFISMNVCTYECL